MCTLGVISRQPSIEIFMNYQPLKANATTNSSKGTSLKFRWRIPEYSDSGCRTIAKSNRYLKHMDMKISALIMQGKHFEATNVFLSMLRKSKSLRVYSLNHFLKGWYMSIPYSQALRVMNRLDRFMKSLPLMVTIKRRYIPKKSGKLRPLGIPDVAMRILNSLWAQYIYASTEHLIMDEQHGFRRGRGVWSAWERIIEETKDPEVMVYEFDLKSFFNKVNPNLAADILKRIDWRLAAYVEIVNRDSIAQFKTYSEESEYTITGRVVKKSGLPQGLPWSPLLASLVLSWAEMRSVIMYADDGVVLYRKGENPLQILLGNPKLNITGIELAWEKSKTVKRYIKFGGLEADLYERTFLLPEGGTISMDGVKTETLKALTGKYYKKSSPKREMSDHQENQGWLEYLKFTLTPEEHEWQWSVNAKSWMLNNFKSPWQTWENFIRYLLRGILRLVGLRKLGTRILPEYYHRYHGFIYDVRQISTHAAEKLLNKRWGSIRQRVIPRHTLRHLDVLDTRHLKGRIMIGRKEFWLQNTESRYKYVASNTPGKYYMKRPRS